MSLKHIALRPKEPALCPLRLGTHVLPLSNTQHTYISSGCHEPSMSGYVTSQMIQCTLSTKVTCSLWQLTPYQHEQTLPMYGKSVPGLKLQAYAGTLYADTAMLTIAVSCTQCEYHSTACLV